MALCGMRSWQSGSCLKSIRMNPTSNTLILGMLSRMSLEQARPIFLSLEKNRLSGRHLRLRARRGQTTLDFLRQRRVNLVPFQMAYLKPAWSWFVNLASPFLQPAQKARLTEEFGLTYLHLQCSRFIYWQSFLREFGQLYQYVMLCDMRDVLFQRPPFDLKSRKVFPCHGGKKHRRMSFYLPMDRKGLWQGHGAEAGRTNLSPVAERPSAQPSHPGLHAGDD